MTGGIGRAGLDAVRPRVPVADHPPVGQQVVGGVQRPFLAEIRGRNHGLGAVADLHELRVLHGGFGDEVEIPCGGVVVGIVEAAGVDEVGVRATQLLRLGVHGVHESGDGTGVPVSQNVAGFVGGDDQHTLQQLLYRQDLAGLDAGGAAVGVVIGVAERAFRRCDLCVEQCFVPADLFQNQKRRHHLGQTGRIVLFMDIFGIGHRVGVHIHQKGGLGLNVWNIQRGSGRGQKQPGQAGAEQKNR